MRRTMATLNLAKFVYQTHLRPSGIALLFQPHSKRQEIGFYTTLLIEFVFHHRFNAILVMRTMPIFMDVQRLQLVFKTSIQAIALT